MRATAALAIAATLMLPFVLSPSVGAEEATVCVRVTQVQSNLYGHALYANAFNGDRCFEERGRRMLLRVVDLGIAGLWRMSEVASTHVADLQFLQPLPGGPLLLSVNGRTQPVVLEHSGTSTRMTELVFTIPLPTPEPPVAAEEYQDAEETPEEPQAPRMTIVLTTSPTSIPVLVPYVTPDHRIEEMSLVVGLEFEDGWRTASTTTAIEPGEERDLRGVQNKRWEDVSRVLAKTLDGSAIHYWACERHETRHDFEGRYVCEVNETEEAADLTVVEEASLWVYVVNRRPDRYSDARHIELHARVEAEGLESIRVRVRYAAPYGSIGHSDFCTHDARPLRNGETQQLVCGRYSGYRGGDQPLPPHTAANAVRVWAGGTYLRCERHQDSDHDRSVWACERW